MNRDDVLRWAREADPFGDAGRLYGVAMLTPETLERFAALAFAAGAASTRPEVAIAQAYMCGREEGAFAERELCTKAAVESLQQAIEQAAAMQREACARLLEDFERFGDTRDCVAAIRRMGTT